MQEELRSLLYTLRGLQLDLPFLSPIGPSLRSTVGRAERLQKRLARFGPGAREKAQFRQIVTFCQEQKWIPAPEQTKDS